MSPALAQLQPHSLHVGRAAVAWMLRIECRLMKVAIVCSRQALMHPQGVTLFQGVNALLNHQD